MIFRAIFWVGFVALLMPREPGSDLNHPKELLSQKVASGVVALQRSPCDAHAGACATGLSLLESFQDKAIRGLAAVKADIDANRRPFLSHPL